jgi:DNA-binding MarR family transcriptional regulator/predicted N-acetyltransferase YhbS
MSQVDAVRRFNRFYTQKIGVLDEGLLESAWSLTQVRVLYELQHRQSPTASELCRDLGLDAGYLSRLLQGFRRRGLVERAPSPDDGRRSLLRLTRRGRTVFAPLDARARKQVAGMLALLPAEERARLCEAMRTIESLLAPRERVVVLRPHRAGDLGWVVQRHGALYSEEYGWDHRFEALVAGVVSEFVAKQDPLRERCWIAQLDGAPVGSIFLVKGKGGSAKLRLLLVEPGARGLGIGRRLVDTCIAFAREVGYRRITLWTQSNLRSARRIYQHAGFQLVGREKHRMFGPLLTAETWALDL